MYLATPHSRRDLNSLPKDQTFAVEEQNPNHWTTRVVPSPSLFNNNSASDGYVEFPFLRSYYKVSY